jgi:outer membrane lipoprotein-sorting protein
MNPKRTRNRGWIGAWTLVVLGALNSPITAQQPASAESQPPTKNEAAKTVVTPANATVTAGQNQQFTATAYLKDGRNQDITRAVHWNSSSSHIATINSGQTGGGLATAKAAGTVTITAMLNGVSGSATLTVNSPLDQVLHSMDQNAAKFHTAQADFSWTPYNAVIGDTEAPDKGRIYFRRVGNEIQMAAILQPPDGRQIVYKDGKVEVYQPKTKESDVYDTSAHKDEAETFLLLGFGSSGQDLRKSFDIKYVGDEKIGNVVTAKLLLTPLSAKVANTFPEIDLWIDPKLGVSLRQKLLQKEGDYRLADYSNIRLDEKVPDSAFKVSPAKTVNH